MRVEFAKGCAWRAVYIRRAGGSLAFSLGIDPTFKHNRAHLFGCVGFRKDCTGSRRGAWSWRLPLWRSRYWWKLDGRRALR